MTRVFKAKDPAQAHVLFEVLERQGIEAIIQDEQMLPVVLPSIFVADEHAERARLLCANFEKNLLEPESSESWFCPTCGEKIDNAFTSCWKCQVPEEAAAASASSEQPSSKHMKRTLAVLAAVIIALYLLMMNARQSGSTRPVNYGPKAR